MKPPSCSPGCTLRNRRRPGGRELPRQVPLGAWSGSPVDLLIAYARRVRGGGQGLVVGADGARDAPADLAQLPGLGLGERIEDEAAYFVDMAGGGLGDLRLALVGQS